MSQTNNPNNIDQNSTGKPDPNLLDKTLLDNIYKNMDDTSRQYGSLISVSIVLSLVLLTVSQQVITIDKKLSFSGLSIELSEWQLLLVLIFAVAATYCAANALEIYEQYLRQVFKDSCQKFKTEINLYGKLKNNDEKPKNDSIEYESIMVRMLDEKIMGFSRESNLRTKIMSLPGLLIGLSIAIIWLLLPIFSVLMASFRLFSLVGFNLLIFLYCLFLLLGMLFYGNRALQTNFGDRR